MTPVKNLSIEFNGLLETIRAYLPQANIERLKEAFSFAMKAHEGQLRRSGEPYIIHPLKTMEILTKFHVDEDTLIAAMLHDVPEDTPHPLDEVEKKFGKKIAYLVEGITKLSKVHYRHDMETRQIESLKKLFIHCAEDLRVILIKLADRLHNMRTLHYHAEERKRIRIARETLEIYVPIANLLGISEIRSELEDLCFEHLYPEECKKLQMELQEGVEERNFILDEMIHLTERELKKNGIEAEIVGRQKTLYSLYRKLQIKKTLGNIDDIIAIRLVVSTRKDCYTALGIVHRLFKPKHGSFKDYIAVPKPNGYQSIHTTVFGINSGTVEYQIRTKYMHLEAEYGIAAHYFYKYSNERELATLMRQRATWVQRILEIQKDTDRNFLENLKLDVFQDRIFVFTPKGDVIDLPKGACMLDFAYAIHTDIGNHAVKAEMNGITYPLSTPLSTGDTVRVVTSKQQRPEREWMNFARTHLAYNKIRAELHKLPYEEKLLAGKRALQKAFDHLGKNFIDELSGKRLKKFAERFSIHTLDDLLVAVGDGTLHPKEIINMLYEDSPAKYSMTLRIGKELPMIRKKGFLSRIGLRILGDNRKGEFREIIRTLNAQKIPVVKFEIDRPWYLKKDRCRLSVLVRDFNELSQVFESIEHLEGIQKISRTFLRRKIIFYFWSFITFAVWAAHPFVIDIISNLDEFGLQESFLGIHHHYISNILLYTGLFSLFALLVYIRRLARRSFPELQETKFFWPTIFTLATLALFTIIVETVIFELRFNWVFVLGIILLVYTLLLNEYLRYKEEQFS